jgi:hypothetical protein
VPQRSERVRRVVGSLPAHALLEMRNRPLQVPLVRVQLGKTRLGRRCPGKEELEQEDARAA